MQWIADGIHDFSVTDHQKNPSEELIISWITSALRDISEEIVESSFLSVSRSFMLVLRNPFFFFLVVLLFLIVFFSAVQNRSVYYIWARIIHG